MRAVQALQAKWVHYEHYIGARGTVADSLNFLLQANLIVPIQIFWNARFVKNFWFSNVPSSLQ